MSKYVKNLISDHLRRRFDGIDEALLVNMVGLDANTNNRLRSVLETQNIQVMVVKNSLARRATEGTALAPMFDGLTGTAAVCWGEEDIVSLAKEITKLAKDDAFAPFETRGGVMDGETLSADQVRAISKWPNRQEQLSILSGQIIGPGAQLAAQLNGPGGTLVSQIDQKAEGEEDETEGDPEVSKGDPEEPKGDSEEPKGDPEDSKGDSEEPKGDSEGSKGDSEEPKGDSEEPKGDSEEPKGDSEEPKEEPKTE